MIPPPVTTHARAPRTGSLRRRLVAATLALGLGVVVPATPVAAQEASSGAAALYESGIVGAGLLLRQLDGVKRVLVVGAHPDDEDTALLSALARGHGAETAYLSLTRGDGGQNLIGPLLGEGLGVVRTGELVAARSLDGGRQFFTRAFDFGYSKSADEALRLWPREELLRDAVWVVRTFRPQVVVSVFSGTPADGHGQHQAAGIIAREAFEAAGDPDRFPDQLDEGATAWQPAKLYRLAWRSPEEADLEVETGVYDPLLGRSWFQVAMASRSRHRSQDMGTAQPLGPRSSMLTLVSTAPGVDVPDDAPLFAGVDTTLASLAEPLPPHGRRGAGNDLERYRADIAEARAALDVASPWDAAPPLARAMDRLVAVRGAAAHAPEAGAELLRVVDRRIELAGEALLDAAAVTIDVRTADDLVVPGQELAVEVELWNGGPYEVVDARPSLDLPDGWSAEPVAPAADDGPGGSFFFRRGGGEVVPVDAPATVAPGASVIWRYVVRVPADADVSELYYLEEARDGAMYRWPGDPDVRALPRQPALAHGRVALSVRLPLYGDEVPARVETRRAARYLGVDKATGQYRTPVLVVPAVSVSTEPGVMVVPTGQVEPRTVSVALHAFAPEAAGTLRLHVPEGWSVEPASVPFDLEAEGQEASSTFTVTPPHDAAPGAYPLRAVATTADGRRHDRSVVLVDHPHIERAAMFEDAATRVTVVDVAVDPDLRVGYVMGSGDGGFAAIRELGVDVELLGPADLREGDLDRFDVLVTGIRAYETRPDLQAANERVLDFARRGGTVLVQYNKYEFPRGGYAPWPVEMSRPHDRVTDEGSPFRFIHPENPVLTHPNEIGPADFEGWVTERGLYFLGEWPEERMTPVLELTDPGEAPKRGSIVVAPLGEGLWIYTGLSFFRQLPEGVPGAWRLFANLLSLDAAEWAAWEAGR